MCGVEKNYFPTSSACAIQWIMKIEYQLIRFGTGLARVRILLPSRKSIIHYTIGLDSW